MKQRTIKTDEHTIQSGFLDVGKGHSVWFEQWGNAKAQTPILVFHGGPGGEFKPKHKYDFDPEQHQVIGYDQRGAGNSVPYGELRHNTIVGLINDARQILDHLGISKVHLSGGSWGSALALLFAIEHPELVETITVRGVFTGTQAEIDWIDKGRLQSHYPEVWERFVASVPTQHRDNPATYHYEVIARGDDANMTATAQALSDLETPVLMYDWRGFAPAVKQDTDPDAPAETFDPVPYKIYGHYFNNACFLEPDYILHRAHTITAPLYIVQGRYDMACPPITAYRLHKAVPHSKLYITLASHGNDHETHSVMKVLRDMLY